jgi:trehalose 6-phosphate phosphatase
MVQVILRRLLAAYGQGRPIVLMSDYDGTLVPLVEHPSLARLDRRTHRLLRRLSSWPGVHVAIVSGRALRDIQALVSLPKVLLAGTSGLELDLHGLRITHPQARQAEEIIARLGTRLREALGTFPDAWVEEKGMGLTVHYRQVPPHQIPPLRSRLETILLDYGSQLQSLDGPMSVEVTPQLGWNKGTAVRQILRHIGGEGAALLYAGDGANDADAFEAVNQLAGITLGIGPDAPATAHCRLSGPAVVKKLLAQLNDALDERFVKGRHSGEKALALYGYWRPFLPTNII